MSRALSPSVARCYGLARVARVWSISRASVYRARALRAFIPSSCVRPKHSNRKSCDANHISIGPELQCFQWERLQNWLGQQPSFKRGDLIWQTFCMAWIIVTKREP